jgi:hypothetical protein
VLRILGVAGVSLALLATANCGGSTSPQETDPRFIGPLGLKTRLDAVAATLAANPPTTAKGIAARKTAITDLDAMLWMVDIAGAPGPDIAAYYRNAMDKLASEMAAPVTDGVRIWAGYNAGFIVKSPGKTVAFDLLDDRPGLASDLPKDFKLFKYTIPASVIDQIDVLVISHEHLDHTGPTGAVAARVKAHGGAVLYPRGGLAFPNATILVDSGSTGTVNGVTYFSRTQPHEPTVSMGYELTLPNGYKIVHQDAGASRIENVKNIDVLFENVWINGSTGICKDAMVRDMTFTKPGITIPSHMHEMSHRTGNGRCGSDRYSYATSLELQDEVTPSKFALLTWGESIIYKR